MPENLERRGNKRYHIYDCERCGIHVEEWVDVQIPPGFKYCDVCAIIFIDELLTELKQGEMFVVFEEHEKELADMGIDKFTFWAAVKVRSGILSRAEMTEVQMVSVIESLRTKPLPKWIADLKEPNHKVRLFAITEEYKSELPEEIWDKIKQKTGVKDLRRLTLAHAKTCYDEIRAELGMDVDTDEPPEGDTAEEKQEASEPETSESNIPF